MILAGSETRALNSQDQLEYLATGSVVAPFIIYTIFLIIIPASLVTLSIVYHWFDKKLNDHGELTEEIIESRKYRPNFNWEGTAMDANFRCLRQIFCETSKMFSQSSFKRLIPTFGDVAATWAAHCGDIKKSCFDPKPLNPGGRSSRRQRNEGRVYSFQILEWLGLANHDELGQIASWINFIKWPIFTRIFGLGKPIVLFLFATFLISLTVDPDEDKERKWPLDLQ